MTKEFVTLSLDIETTTSNPETGVVLSVGMIAFETGKRGYWQIQHDHYPCDPQSMNVNQIDIRAWDGKLLEIASMEISEFLWDITQGSKKIMPMGFNVGGFDLPYMKKYFPEKVMVQLGYRSVDLNTLIYTEAENIETNFKSLKEKMKKRASFLVAKTNPELKPHHALYDALSNCFIYSKFVETPEWIQKLENN